VTNEKELFSAFNESQPDVVLLDPMVAHTSGTSLVQRLREVNESIGILIFSNQNETQATIKWLRAGARGYVGKKSSPEEMIVAIRNVALGGAYISNELAEQLALNAIGPQGPHSNFTARELEIFRLLAEGMSNKEIGVILNLSVKTVSTYKSRIFLRMGFSSITDLVMYALSYKLMPELTAKRSAR
jgi:DNA-binding NarL/FixJ family response regulator